MESGKLWLAKAMKNKAFAKSIADSSERYAKVAESGEKRFSVAEDGSFVTKYENNMAGWLKPITSLNLASATDQEAGDIYNRFQNTYHTKRVYKPKITFEGSEGKSMSINAYQEAVKRKFEDVRKTHEITLSDYKDISQEVFPKQ